MQADITNQQPIDLFAQKIHLLSNLLDADYPVAAAHSLYLKELHQQRHFDTLGSSTQCRAYSPAALTRSHSAPLKGVQ